MATTNDEVLLKLVLKGVDPAEAQRLAQASLGGLEGELKASLQRQIELHRVAAESTNAQSRKYAQDEIKDQLKRTSAISGAMKTIENDQTKAARASEVAANRTKNAWRRTLEDLENVTTVARGVWDAISGGAERLHALGESITRVTNIYGSLQGSLEEMRQGSLGQVSDIDLILTKNDALAKGLKLTDDQFGLLAGAANAYADSLGKDVRGTLDQLVQGLATGRQMTLQSAGVMISATQANREYAESNHRSADSLSENEKKIALVRAALQQMNQKLLDSGKAVDDFALKWQQTTAEFDNLKDDILRTLAPILVSIAKFFTQDLPNAIAGGFLYASIAVQNAKKYIDPLHLFWSKRDVQDAIDQAHRDLKSLDDVIAADAQAFANADAERIAKAQARMKDPNAFNANLTGGDTEVIKKAKEIKDAAEGVDRLFAARDLAESQILERLKQENTGAEELIRLLEGAAPKDQGQATEDMVARAEDKFFRGANVTAGQQEKLQAQFDAAMSAAAEFKSKLDAETAGYLQEAGGGLIGKLLFGPGGVMEQDKLKSQLDETTQFVVSAVADMAGQVSAAGEAMAGALGHSLAATIGEGADFQNSLKQGTHALLMSLSEQAYARAAMETALGLASLALGPIGGVSAGAHFAAAAAFAAVGTTAGLGARATYSKPAATSSTGTTPTSSRSPVSSGKSASGGGGDMPPVILNIHVNPGGEEAAGRSLIKSIKAYKAATGKDIIEELRS